MNGGTGDIPTGAVGAADAAGAAGAAVPAGERPAAAPSVFVRSLASRWAFPGPRTRRRPAALGSIGGAAIRFTAGLGQAPRIRRHLDESVPGLLF